MMFNKAYWIILLLLRLGVVGHGVGEVFLQLGGGAAVVVGQVADDAAVLQQGDAGRDVDGVLQVVAADEDDGSRLFGIVGQQVFEDELAGGVEEVERLVEDDYLRAAQQGADDANLHLVAGREIADELLLAEDFASGEALELLEALFYFLLADARHFAEKGKVLFGREEVDEEAFVDVGSYVLLPGFALGGVDEGDRR